MFESATDVLPHMSCHTYSMYPMKSNVHQLIREVLSGKQHLFLLSQMYITDRNLYLDMKIVIQRALG